MHCRPLESTPNLFVDAVVIRHFWQAWDDQLSVLFGVAFPEIWSIGLRPSVESNLGRFLSPANSNIIFSDCAFPSCFGDLKPELDWAAK